MPLPLSAECFDAAATEAEATESGAVGEDALLFPLKLDQIVRQMEKAENAVKASQSRRAPNPGGAVQMNRNLLRSPRKRRPVHLGLQDQPITRPIITASHIGTAHSKMSTNVSVIVGFAKNSTRSKKASSISEPKFSEKIKWKQQFSRENQS